MEYREWKALMREMAIYSFCIEAADMMIPADRARATALQRAEASDNCHGPGVNQSDAQVQAWRGLERHMGNALIALEKLGYTIRKD